MVGGRARSLDTPIWISTLNRDAGSFQERRADTYKVLRYLVEERDSSRDLQLWIASEPSMLRRCLLLLGREGRCARLW